MDIDSVSERKCIESILNRNIETAQFFSVYTSSPFRLSKKYVEYDNTKSTQVHSDRENIDIKINMPIYIRKEVSTNVSDAFLQNNIVNHEIEKCYTYESLDKKKLNHIDRSTECLRTWQNYSSISAINRTDHIGNNRNQCVSRKPYSNEILNDNEVNNLKLEEIETERYNFNYSSHTSDNKIEYVEKTTCSRPINNLFNEDFISKTLHRNERLKYLLHKIIIQRQKSKEYRERNNYYVNMHNNKYSRENAPRTMKRDIKHGEDFCKAEATHENDYRHLPDNFYRRNQTLEYDNDRYKPMVDEYIYKNNTCCFPTSSQGKMGREINDSEKYCISGIRYENLCKNKTGRKTSESNKNALFNSGNCSKTLEIKTNRCLQTDMVLVPLFKDKVPVTVKSKSQTWSVKTDVISEKTRQSKRDTSKEAKMKVQHTDVPDKVRRLRMKLYGPDHTHEKNSIKGIERKLEELRTTINKLILETKDVKSETEGTTVLKCDYNDKLKPSEATSDTLRLRNTDKLVCGFDVNSSKSTPVSSDCYHTTCNKNNNNLDVVPAEEMISIEKYINDLFLKKQIRLPYTIKINFDIPTKDHSTEVTASLSKAKCEFEQDNRNKENAEVVDVATSNYAEKRMTIAVNTDPLGILSLLRVSADTIRRLLSFMPNFNYSRNSSKLQLPQLNGEMSYSYICNFCGAAFLRPLQLTDHIQCHHLKFPRDCCVCRHELDIQRIRPVDRYNCQYCKQGFTRAYCCELHQQSCAKRFGKKRDVSTSLLLLR